MNITTLSETKWLYLSFTISYREKQRPPNFLLILTILKHTAALL